MIAPEEGTSVLLGGSGRFIGVARCDPIEVKSKSPRKGLQDKAMLTSARLKVCFMFGVNWLICRLNRGMYG